MRRFTEYLSGAAVVLFQVALTGWMFVLSEVNFDFSHMKLNYIQLSALMLAAYALNLIMLRRGVSVPVYAAVQVFVVAGGVFVFIRAAEMEPFVLRTLVINCIVYCIGFVVTAMVAWVPTDQNGMVRRFDILAAMIALMLVLDHLLGFPGADGAVGMCCFSLLLTLLASVSLKSGALAGRGSAVHGNPVFGRILLFAVFGLIALIALLVLLYAASGIGSFSEFLIGILTACFEGIKAAFRMIVRLLDRLAQWLSQFSDDTSMEPLEMEGMGSLTLPPMEETEIVMPVWIYYLLAAAVFAVIAFVVFRLRKLRAAKIRPRVAVIVEARRESGLKAALRDFWKMLYGEMRFRFQCLRYRRSSAGLLVWCEKRAPEELRRSDNESGECFLRRLGKALGEGAEQTLAELACFVERSFYSPIPVEIPSELYKRVKRIEFKWNLEKQNSAG